MAWLALACLLSWARVAAAGEDEAPKPDGVDIALRAGYGIPLGSLATGTDFSALMAGLVPFTFEIGGRFNTDATAGLLLGYGIGLVKNGPSTGCGVYPATCSSRDYRLALQILYRLNVPGSFTRTFTPWLGFDIGYEWLSVSVSQGFEQSLSMRGFEFGAVQAGGDFHVTPTFALGPYASCSVGEFSNVGGATVALHTWLQLGVRAAWSLSGPGD